MKRLSRKLFFGLIGLLPLATTGTIQSVYAANEGDTATSLAPADVDAGTLARYRTAIHAACGAASDIMGITYHEEAQKVDLSSFDGCSATVNLSDVDRLPPNGED